MREHLTYRDAGHVASGELGHVRLRLVVQPHLPLLHQLHDRHAGERLGVRRDTEQVIRRQRDIVRDVRQAHGMIHQQLALKPDRNLRPDERHIPLLQLQPRRHVRQRGPDRVFLVHLGSFQAWRSPARWHRASTADLALRVAVHDCHNVLDRENVVVDEDVLVRRVRLGLAVTNAGGAGVDAERVTELVPRPGAGARRVDVRRVAVDFLERLGDDLRDRRLEARPGRVARADQLRLDVREAVVVEMLAQQRVDLVRILVGDQAHVDFRHRPARQHGLLALLRVPAERPEMVQVGSKRSFSVRSIPLRPLMKPSICRSSSRSRSMFGRFRIASISASVGGTTLS